MNDRAREIHADNAIRILRERDAMAARLGLKRREKRPDEIDAEFLYLLSHEARAGA